MTIACHPITNRYNMFTSGLLVPTDYHSKATLNRAVATPYHAIIAPLLAVTTPFHPLNTVTTLLPY